MNGKVGRTVLLEWLPSLQDQHRPLFTIVNGENAAGGLGLTPVLAEEMYAAGVDAITLGNHAFNKRDIGPYMDRMTPGGKGDTGRAIVRPINMANAAPGRGWTSVKKDGIELCVINLCGRVNMEPHYDDPFWAWDRATAALPSKHRFVDFHAEATSEKVAFGWHVDGRATAVVGTHTHVQTADERVLPGGTAYITDVGMCGPRDGVIGMDREIILRRFRSGLPERFESASGPGTVCGVVVTADRATGRALSIRRVLVGDVPNRGESPIGDAARPS